MALYIIKRTGSTDYDQYDSFVVRAVDSKQARKLAAEGSSDEGAERLVWLDPKLSTCRQLSSSGKSEVVLGSFNAG